jgi:hypothetical protein
VRFICRHRVNTVEELQAVPPDSGVEIDLRSNGGHIIVAHDVFAAGPRFETWLSSFHHAFLVLNLKEEGLEDEVRTILASRGVKSWAFLDQSFPYLVRSLERNETNVMVRVSEFESPTAVLKLFPRPKWVWLDSFTGKWPSYRTVGSLKRAGFSIMVASPELHARKDVEEIFRIKAIFQASSVAIDAVCTRRPELWR